MEHLLEYLPVSALVGGLFITDPVSTLPDVFAAWSVVRSGQATSGSTSVIADNVDTLSLALVPLGLVTVPILDLRLFATDLLFAWLFPALCGLSVYWSGETGGFSLRQVIAFDALYAVYTGVVFQWLV